MPRPRSGRPDPSRPVDEVRRQLERDIASLWNDPLAFVMFAFPWKKEGTALEDEEGPDEWQVKVLTLIRQHLLQGGDAAEALQIAVASGHGIGKTTLIAWLILWFISTREKPAIVVTANTQTQLNTKTWRELAKWHKLSRNRDWFRWTATRFYYVEHPEDWFAQAVPWSKERAEAFAGTHEKHVLFVFDESSLIDDVIWETADGAMTTPGAMWVVFGNPTRNIGRFRECFVGGKFQRRWKSLQIDSRTAKKADKRKIQQWIEDYGEDSDFVRVRVRGVFPRSASNQLIPVDLVEDAMRRKVDDAILEDWPKILTCDPARFGDNETVVGLRQGPKFSILARWREVDTMQVASRLAEFLTTIKPEVCFVDAGGIGAGVLDRLSQLGFGDSVIGIHSQSQAGDPLRYANKRAEMWVLIRDWLKAPDAVLPPDEQLKADLIGPEYGFDAKNRYQIEKKEDMKARGLSSPDSADALALSFAQKVARRETTRQLGAVARAIQGLSTAGRTGLSWMSR